MPKYEVVAGIINWFKVGETVDLSVEDAKAIWTDYVKAVKGGESDEPKALNKLNLEELKALCVVLEIVVETTDTKAILAEKISNVESEKNPYNNKQIK